MGWRLEGNDLVIDGWKDGMSETPFGGFVDIDFGSVANTPGEFASQFPLVGNTLDVGFGTAFATPVQVAVPYSGGTVTKYVLLDSKGQIWISDHPGGSGPITWSWRATPGGDTSSATRNSGIVWWKGYALKISTNKIWYCHDTSGDFNVWVDWSTVDASITGIGGFVTHFAIVGVDDAVYFCNGSAVGSILQNAGMVFDPTNPLTYTFNAAALRLPANDNAICLAELQAALLVGGSLNRIYNWDRIDTTFDNVIYLAENYVNRMVTTNTNTYVFCGNPVVPTGRGNIYVTNGTNITLFKKMPDFYADLVFPASTPISQEPYWVFGDAMFHRNMLVFSAASYTNGTTTLQSLTGVIWALDITTKNLIQLNAFAASFSKLATLVHEDDTGVNIDGLGYFTGYDGVMNNSSSVASTGIAVASTGVIPVGTFLGKATFDNMEVKLSLPLGAGDSLFLYAGVDFSGSAITVGSMTSADGVGASFPVNFQNAQWLQVSVITGPTAPSTFCRVKEIRLRKSK